MGLTPSQQLMDALNTINDETIQKYTMGFKSTNPKYRPHMIESIKKAIKTLNELLESE